MKFKLCRVRINVTNYDVTFVIKGESNPQPSVATPLARALLSEGQFGLDKIVPLGSA